MSSDAGSESDEGRLGVVSASEGENPFSVASDSEVGDALGAVSDSEGEDSIPIHLTDSESAESVVTSEIPIPPKLPAAPEERLRAVWPLGTASFDVFLCPITHDAMRDPVICQDGYTYERQAITDWFE